MEKRNLLRSQIVLVFVLAILMSAPSYAGEVRGGVTGDTIKIGLITDLTGPVAMFLVTYANSHRDYFRLVNEEGGIHGRKIKLIVEDDRYSIPTAIAAFKKLVYRDEVLCISGPGGTGQHTALFSQFEKSKMPSFGITISPIMFTPYKRYVFAPPGDYWDFAGVAYDYIVNKMKVKDPKIAIARPDTEGGKVFAAGAKKWAGFFNQKYYEEIVAVGAMDVTSQVLSLKANGINNVLVGALPTPEVALVLSTGRRFQYFPNVWGIHYGCGEDAIERAGAAAGNYYGLHAFSQWYDDTPEMKKVRETFLRYRPKSKPPVNYYQMGWYWGIIISEGLKRAGREVDGEKLVDALETLRDFDTGGLCGPVTYTSKSHKATNYCRIFKTDVKKKVLVPLTDWMKPAE